VYGQTDASVETYRIVETFPHDVNDYTEGLFIHDGHLTKRPANTESRG
jgi:glutamine cyclotransferase